MNTILALLLALLSQPLEGIASRFGTPHDKYGSSSLRCDRSQFAKDGDYCAHRSLPCGTELLLYNTETGRTARCKVMDRGPYGAIMPDGTWAIKKKARDPGRWRGVLDLSPSVSRALKHDGWARVKAWVIRGVP